MTNRPKTEYVQRVLHRAFELLSDRKRWTKSTLAVNAGGHHTKPESEDAVAWCAVGAMQRSAWELCQADPCVGADYVNLTACAQQTLTPMARKVAHLYNPARGGSYHQEVTAINDHAYWGGWQTIITSLAAVCGRTAEITPELRRELEKSAKRSAASVKGWETRRKRWADFSADYEARKALLEAQDQPMVFGGTVNAVTVTTSADASTPAAEIVTH